MECLICGKSNADSARFCGACGADLTRYSATAAVSVHAVSEESATEPLLVMPAAALAGKHD